MSPNLDNDPLVSSFYKMGFGFAQFYVYFLACMGSFLCAPVYVDSNFLIRRVKARCAVPGCDTEDTTFDDETFNWTIPEKDPICSMYTRTTPVTNASTCAMDDFDLTKTTNCTEWVYDNSIFKSTAMTEFDLTCDNAWLAPLAGSMYMVGMLIGAFAIGDLADRFGRKFGIVISVILLGCGGILSAVSPNYFMFLAMRFLTGVGGVGLFQSSFVLAIEFIGAKYRTFCGIMIQMPFALGEAMVGVTAIFIREWRWLEVALTAPVILLLSYVWLMPESVRWLVSQGQREKAIAIIKKAADVNGVEVPKHLLEDNNVGVATVDGTISVASSKADLVKEELGEPEPKVRRTVLDLLKTPNMRNRSLIKFYCWIVITLVYYGISSNSGNLAGNIFLNFILTMLIEIPSYVFCVIVLDRMGRKGTLSFVLLLGGAACIGSGFVPEEYTGVIVGLSLVGKFGGAAAFAIVYVYAAEIFPTDYRSIGVGTCSMCARIGGIIAPFIASLAHIRKFLPLLIFGVLSISAGFLVILLPETVGSELPQTLAEAEEFGSDHSIWHFHCIKRKKKQPDTREDESTEDQRV